MTPDGVYSKKYSDRLHFFGISLVSWCCCISYSIWQNYIFQCFYILNAFDAAPRLSSFI